MQVVSIISTKGGVGKTTTAANVGGLAADAGLSVLLLDLDVQPTLSSYYELTQRAPGGIYELLAFNERVKDAFLAKRIRAPVHLCDPNQAEPLISIFKESMLKKILQYARIAYNQHTTLIKLTILNHTACAFKLLCRPSLSIYNPLAFWINNILCRTWEFEISFK